MLLKPVQVEYYQNRAAQMCSFLTEIKICCSHRHSGSRWLSFLFPGRVNLQKKVQIRVAYMNEKNLIPGLPSSRPPHSEHEPQAYHAKTRALASLHCSESYFGGHMEYSVSPESVTVRLTNDSFGIVRGQRTQNNTVYIQYSKYKTVKLRKIESQ